MEVLDEKDTAPQFVPPSYAVTVSESAVPGYVALRVTARDADDGDVVSYSIVSGNAQRLFIIDTHSGEWRLRSWEIYRVHSWISNKVGALADFSGSEWKMRDSHCNTASNAACNAMRSNFCVQFYANTKVPSKQWSIYTHGFLRAPFLLTCLFSHNLCFQCVLHRVEQDSQQDLRMLRLSFMRVDRVHLYPL